MKKGLVIAGMTMLTLSVFAQSQTIKIQELTSSKELGKNRAARAQEVTTEENVVSTQTPNGTLWLVYDKARNEVTLDYLTRDSVVSKTYTTKVPRNKDLHGELYLPGIIQNGEAKGAKLVRIKDNAFQGCNNLTAIIVPSTVEELGGGALRTNNKLKAIIIPESVKKVGRNHTGLQVTNYLTSTQTMVVNSQAALSDSVIYYGSGIKTLIIGDSVRTINSMNFMQNDSLSSITIGRNVSEIGTQAFMGCKNLRTIHLPASVKKIHPMAFHYGAGYTSNFTPTPLERIEVEDYDTYKLLVDSGVNLQSYTRIYLAGNDITGTYTSKQEEKPDQPGEVTKRELPEGATEIPDFFFSGDTTLTSYVIPSTVTRIGNYAFHNCSNLESVVIPNSVTTIDGFVFCLCPKLKSLTIPESVTFVNQNAFYSCNEQLQVTFLGNMTDMIWEDHMLLSTDKTILYDGSNLGKKFYIPETVTDVRSVINNIDNLHIPAKVMHLPREMALIKSITVDKDNKAYIVLDNVLYSKDMKTLVAIPQIVKGKYIVPESVDSICPYAVRANATEAYYIFNLDIFQLNRMLPTALEMDITTSDKIIYLLPQEYYSQYSWQWGYNVFDVATYVVPVISPIKIGKKLVDRYSAKVKVNEWPAERQPIYLEMNGISYPFNPVDSTFFVDRLDTICNYLNKIEGKYDSYRYIPFTVYPKKGSDILPARDSVYYKGSSSSFHVQSNKNTYTSYEGDFFIYNDHEVNSDEFQVECKIGTLKLGYQWNEVERRTINFTRNDLKPLSSLRSSRGYHFMLDGLKPGYRIIYEFYAKYNGEMRVIGSAESNIPNFIMEADHLSCGTTTVSGRITCDAKDLGVIMKGVNGKAGSEFFTLTGQTPGKVAALDVFVTALIAGKDTTFHKTIYLPMAQLELTTLQPTNINNNSARLMAATTIDDKEAAVGFEWRRYDAPEEMLSYSIDGAVYQGLLMATLTGLDQTTYYRFRPYLKTADETYYGEWYIFGTNSNAGVTAPVVHTTDAAMDANDAFTYLFTGYVLPGSETIEEQGFEYWPVGNAGSRQRVRAEVENVNSILATGMRMTATAKGLEPMTKYAVRTFAKTASQTVYGETITLKTTTLSGIFAPMTDGTTPDVYSTTGVLVRHHATTLSGLPKGLYIVNGMKVLVK